ncbi:hypothetical protein IQ251_04120 [Saccharopolyspora sp. HNM0983]|uniref:Uncharacterized protein n=1 Tax=Saccharopolyspora montiporae TaxID=2781240 RepID=A0A929B908_9PSEU|nr:hypothetical protein [Saccharopolyspora sp. HNM0983]MBE9373631.1 hypothetical protein [Saccharopolyspora sp. HNM0983]
MEVRDPDIDATAALRVRCGVSTAAAGSAALARSSSLRAAPPIGRFHG